MSAISVAADFIKQHEGLRFSAYQDSGGVWTIGYGTTGQGIKEGLIWDQDQCEKALNNDIQIAFSGLRKIISQPLSDQQLAALLSFVYNLGLGALKGSTLLKTIEDSDWLASAKEFIRWDHVGSDEVKGLLIRRLDEAALFLRGS
jgi:lysozyme